jgi:hypothetical protein
MSPRIDLILSAGPQEVQPGILSSMVFCAAAAGAARMKSSSIAAIILTVFFRIIPLPFSRELVFPHAAITSAGFRPFLDRMAKKIH